jgi:CRP/FNR family cyclic AMP-dependent transcriptional regulator
VMVQLAQGLACLGTQVWELRFLSVQQRVRNLLARLAAEHGRVTPEGVRIELRITHEEIAEWVGADRSTVTTALKSLQEQGYLHRHGRQLVLLSRALTPAELRAFDPAHPALLLEQFVS